MNIERIGRIKKGMVDNNLEQIIVTSTPDIFYILEKWIEPGERLLALYINVKGDVKLVINKIVTDTNSIQDIEVYAYTDEENPVDILANIIDGTTALGIDKNWPAHFLIELMESIPSLKPLNSSKIVDSVRMIKDFKEIEILRNASSIADNAVKDLVNLLKNGITEIQGAENLRDIFKRYNTYQFSFDPIIAYGKNCANPHHTPSEYLPDKGDSIIIDIGGRTNNYCSDITRTVFYGKPDDEWTKIYNIVLEANMAAIEFIKPGVRFCDIDKAAREIIENRGYGQHFTHRTGHSLGIEIHENPSVSSKNTMTALPGMLFSIEPGIYIPGKGGVRIEDIVLVTDYGVEVLNKCPKELSII